MKFSIIFAIICFSVNAIAEEKMQTKFDMSMMTDSGITYSFNEDLDKVIKIKLPGAIQAAGWDCTRGTTVLNNAGNKYYTVITCTNDYNKTIIGASAACSATEKSNDFSKFDLITYSNKLRVSVTFSASCQTESSNPYGI